MDLASDPVVERLVPGLIHRAAEMFGDMARLAHHLGVADHSLHLWALGKARAPTKVVETLVDLVLKDDIARAREDRRHEPRGHSVSVNHSNESVRAQ